MPLSSAKGGRRCCGELRREDEGVAGAIEVLQGLNEGTFWNLGGRGERRCTFSPQKRISLACVRERDFPHVCEMIF